MSVATDTWVLEPSKDRPGGAAGAAVHLRWVEPMDPDSSLAPVYPTTSWWNTGINTISNATSAIVRVLNQETQESLVVPPAGRATSVGWFLPWCNTYDEVAVKALAFRPVPPATPTARGSRLFYIFQDYGSDTAMWLPPGVTDFGFREPIETSPGSGGVCTSKFVREPERPRKSSQTD